MHGVEFCISLSRCCLGPVIGVLAARSSLPLGVEGVFGVFGVCQKKEKDNQLTSNRNYM